MLTEDAVIIDVDGLDGVWPMALTPSLSLVDSCHGHGRGCRWNIAFSGTTDNHLGT